ncbi:hypothetical protein [uncultured Sphingomonas sp.]|uniref:hypothetical protein n=1 Tax=uncultured Sphingomonas sp. TaxID=158754 RepID=UPI0035C9F97A
MLWVLVALSSIELIVVHGLIAAWSWPVAAVLSAMSLTGIGWIVALIRSMKRLPVLLGPEMLVMRIGTFRSVAVPLADAVGLRSSWDGGVVKARTTLNMALVAYPNVVLDLRSPLPGKRGVVAIAHRLDDPVGFAAALERLGAGG